MSSELTEHEIALFRNFVSERANVVKAVRERLGLSLGDVKRMLIAASIEADRAEARVVLDALQERVSEIGSKFREQPLWLALFESLLGTVDLLARDYHVG